MTAPVAKFVVSLSGDGRILNQGDLDSVLAKDKKLQSLVSKELQALKKDDERIEESKVAKDAQKSKPNGQLVVEEEVALGHLGLSACTRCLSNLHIAISSYFQSTVKLYIGNMASPSSAFLFWTAFTIAMLLSKIFSQLDMWVLAMWSAEYEHHDPSEVSVA